jgi:DNA-binding response OmpR family regulator
MRALVVAADHDRRAALLVALEALGIDRFAAGSFDEARAILARWPFELVVIDAQTHVAAVRRFIGDDLAFAEAPAIVLFAGSNESALLGRDLDVPVVDHPSELGAVVDDARPAVLCVA